MTHIDDWKRIAEDLQTRVAFQEDTIQALSLELARQGSEIERLRIQFKDVQQKNLDMREQLEALANPSLDERPPHY